MTDAEYERVKQEVKRIDRELKAAALEAEGPAVYNYQEIRKQGRQLEAAAEHRQRLMARIRDLERQNTKLERSITTSYNMVNIMPAAVSILSQRLDKAEKSVKELENALADARRDHELLTRLVVRMGQTLQADHRWPCKNHPFPFTPIGQAEYDAAMHEAEGPTPTREDMGL